MTSQFRNFTMSRRTKYKPHYHETMMLNQNPCINFFYLFFAFFVPQCPKIEMKKNEPVMIPLFRTRLNQDSFEVFDWTLEIPNQIRKYSRLKVRDFLVLFSSPVVVVQLMSFRRLFRLNFEDEGLNLR